MNIKDRFQQVTSSQIGPDARMQVCKTCGAVVPKDTLWFIDYEPMDCEQIHHDWHEKMEQQFRDIPAKNWETH